MADAQPAPPGASLRREEGAGIVLLIAASLLLLPVLYALLSQDAAPSFVLATGLLSMGLGWAAGLFLEHRLIPMARILGGVGVLAAGAALYPPLAGTLHAMLVSGAALLALVALVLLRRR